MNSLLSALPAEPQVLLAATAVMLFAGLVKGAVGFGLPLLFTAGLSLVLPIQVVVALIAIPAMVTNLYQAQHTGMRDALACLLEFRLLVGVVLVVTWFCTHLVGILPEQTLMLILGAGAFSLTILQVAGWPRQISPRGRLPAEIAFGLVAGFFGGLSGLWGVVLVNYFLALRLGKDRFVTTTGITWMVCTIPYVIGHIQHGILTAPLAVWSVAGLVPTLGGMWIGRRIQKLLNPVIFRRLVIFVVLLATLNLIRRGLGIGG